MNSYLKTVLVTSGHISATPRLLQRVEHHGRRHGRREAGQLAIEAPDVAVQRIGERLSRARVGRVAREEGELAGCARRRGQGSIQLGQCCRKLRWFIS